MMPRQAPNSVEAQGGCGAAIRILATAEATCS